MKFLKLNQMPALEFSSAGNLLNDNRFLHSDRCLNTFVLLIGNEGELYISQDGEQHVLSKDQFLILFPGLRHFGYRESEGLLNYYWCHFYIRGCDFRISEQDEPVSYAAFESGNFFLPEFGNCFSPNKIHLLFRQLIDTSRKPGAQHINDLFITLLLTELAYSVVQESAEKHNPVNPSINRITDYIMQNYNQPISIGMLAEKYGYNPNYLSTLFKKCTGMSPVTYINHVRIDVAKSLLLNSSNSIHSIANQVGFSDDKYFMKAFKTFENTTPTKYRNTYSDTHINSK